MNIGIIGAPSSGKSAFAEELANQLEIYDPSCGCKNRKVRIVDNYISEIEQETNLALGPIADYLGNLYVALGRYAREREARIGEGTVITCGTMIETAIYFSLHVVSIGDVTDDETKAEFAPRFDATMRILSCLFTDIFSYDHVFYLPARAGDEDTAYVDKQIQGALEGFKLVNAILLEDPETRLEKALEEIGSAVQTS